MLGIYIDKIMVIVIIVFSMLLFITLKSFQRFSEAAGSIESHMGFGNRLIELVFVGLIFLGSVVALLVCVFQGRATIFWLS